ncbi:MAG: aminotransferase class V-fold PLP-dependent enzyme, partial [candidate division WOR-3 bacterium]
MKRVYLDNNSTTPLDPRVAAALEPFLKDVFGNPSNLHFFGRMCAEGLAEARKKVACFLGSTPEEIYFTSGGTEANNWALKGVAFASEARGRHIVTSPIEHGSVLTTCQYLSERGWRISYLPVDQFGLIDPEDVRRTLTKETVLVSVMLANNEIGTIEPVKEIAAICHEAGVLCHTDAVAAAGKIQVDVRDLGVDLLTISGHKLHAPKGTGVLYIRKGTKIHSLIHGGHQERGLRAGTENVLGIIGLGKSCELLAREWPTQAAMMKQLRDRFEQLVLTRIPKVRLNGHPTRRVPNVSHFSIGYVEGEALLMNLDLEGIAVASGSACASGEAELSPTLRALRLEPLYANSPVRFSFGKDNTEEDVDLAS